jgi:seryl-tRNA synthetase
LVFLKSLLGGNEDLVKRLQDEVRRLKQAQNDEVDFAMGKTQKLQREICDADDAKRELQQKINKLEAQKGRLEQVFKATMKGGNTDLIDEVQMLVRRIEFLEEQSEKRAKAQYLENQEPYMREIEMLKSKLMQEREIRDQIVQKKNAEVSYFKAELDALLSEMSN